MKKLLLFVVIVLLLALASLYYFIPANLVIVETAHVHCVADAGFRALSNEKSWAAWWPEKGSQGKPVDSVLFYSLGKHQFGLSKKLHNNFEILISSEKDILPSEMNLFSIAQDSSLLKWQVTIHAGNNPFERISAYNRALDLKNQMHTVLAGIQTYLSSFRNVYGFQYRESSTKDTMLISTKTTLTHLPSTAETYALVEKLKTYCKGDCKVTGPPMLNVTPMQDSNYRVMVALPVNRMMLPSQDVQPVKMVPGKFIVTEVVGGTGAVKKAHEQIQHYFQDYRRTAMAIPFEYLITDRRNELDSNKWVTAIFAPVY
ncbi:MAG TPA: hypothetical protein VL307_07310 [Chitinophagaceae bacterium]|nr:hypothetical protein [Chitinophagaceae bacterium]